mgnify:CR=1 FL=1
MSYIYNKVTKVLVLSCSFVLLGSFTPVKNQFTAAEQQQISIATPGLFDQSSAFNVDFEIFRAKEYSFPLPVGKASLAAGNSALKIETTRGDAVKAMFDGHVRLARKTESQGNVIVIRHDNGLETVYANNAENLVKVGQFVEAGQTIAIVGTKNDETYCEFSIMVNGARINPETILEVKSHKLRRQTVQFRKSGNRVTITVIGGKDSSVGREASNKESSRKDNSVASDNAKKSKNGWPSGETLDPDEVNDPFILTNTFELDLRKIEDEHWAYPLPGAKVISPYGGSRRHSGVDLKTKPNDEIVAAFDGDVIASGPYYGYGNCIRIKHAFGFETLYSHQSRNMVKKGDKVRAGQVIGLTGRTGRATTEHLHFEMSFGGKRFDPAMVFDHANRKLQTSTLQLTKGASLKKKK